MKIRDLDNASAVLYIVFAVVCFIAYVVLIGLTTEKMWLWFLVPTVGVAPITWLQGLGINMIISWWTYKPFQNKQEEVTKTSEYVGNSIKLVAYPLFTLLFAWLLHSVM